MTTYSISAPDGNTYQIEGPEGASDDQVRAEVLRQHPNAGSTAEATRALHQQRLQTANASLAAEQNRSKLPDVLGSIKDTALAIPDTVASTVAGMTYNPAVRGAGGLSAALTGNEPEAGRQWADQHLAYHPMNDTTKLGQDALAEQLSKYASPVTAPVGSAITSARSHLPDTVNDVIDRTTGVVGDVAGLAPLGGLVSKGTDAVARSLASRFTAQGRATKMIDKAMGPSVDRASLIDALQKSPEMVAGSAPTAAQAVAHLPEGSPIQALTDAVAQQQGGPSVAFGQRIQSQEAARVAAKAARDEATAPMREAALSSAGQVSAKPVMDEIAAIGNDPKVNASTIVAKTVKATRKKLESLVGTDGTIDANQLYTIRKELGTTIKSFSKETSNWDKKLTAGLQDRIQESIDSAIEQGGGTGWRDYLKTYADQSQPISADIAREELAKTPAQRTAVPGVTGQASSGPVELPHTLSHSLVGANFVSRLMGQGYAPSTIRALSEMALDPKKMAAALQRQPSGGLSQALKEYLSRSFVAAPLDQEQQ